MAQQVFDISSIKQKDPDSFRGLVETFKDNVYNTCFGFLRNAEDAQDVAQEVFIEVFESIGGFREDAKLSTWIYRIAVTKSLEYLRWKKRKKRWARVQSLWNSEGEATVQLPSYDHPGIVLENKERADILFRKIDALAENQKIAFTLHKIEGLSYQEIAEIMKTSVSAVESLMFRAKRNLRKSLQGYYEKEIL